MIDDYAEALRELREVRGWTGRRIADAIGSVEQSVYNWEHGRSRPHRRFQEALVDLVAESQETPEEPQVRSYYSILLKRIRAAQRWAQAQLAEKLGVTQGQVSLWERGVSTPSRSSRERIQALLEGMPDIELPNLEVEERPEHWRQRLLALRQRRLWSQTQLAQEVGVTRQAVSQWEAGATIPAYLMRSRIADLEKEAGIDEDDLAAAHEALAEPGERTSLASLSLEARVDDILARLDRIERVLAVRLRRLRPSEEGG